MKLEQYPQLEIEVPEFLNIGTACTSAHMGTTKENSTAMIIEDSILGTSEITYKDLNQQSDRFSNFLQKIKLDKPHYYVNVDGERVKLEDITFLLEQRLFQRAVAEQLNKRPPAVKPKDFGQYIDGLLANVEEVDPPKGATKVDLFGSIITRPSPASLINASLTGDLDVSNFLARLVSSNGSPGLSAKVRISFRKFWYTRICRSPLARLCTLFFCKVPLIRRFFVSIGLRSIQFGDHRSSFRRPARPDVRCQRRDRIGRRRKRGTHRRPRRQRHRSLAGPACPRRSSSSAAGS